jgi:hypothetical protein
MSRSSRPKNGITWPMMTQTRKTLGRNAEGRTGGDLGREGSGDPVPVPFEHTAAFGDIAQE